MTQLTSGNVATGSEDETIRIWKGAECILTLKGHAGLIYCLVGLPEDDLLSGSEDGEIKKWNEGGHCLATFSHHKQSVNALL